MNSSLKISVFSALLIGISVTTACTTDVAPTKIGEIATATPIIQGQNQEPTATQRGPTVGTEPAKIGQVATGTPIVEDQVAEPTATQPDPTIEIGTIEPTATQPLATATSTPRETTVSTSTSAPTSTPLSTNTPAPMATPLPINTPTPTPPPTHTPTPQAPTIFQVGDILSIGDIVLVVTEWESPSGSDFFEPDEGNMFVVVDVILVNQGDDPGSQYRRSYRWS